MRTPRIGQYEYDRRGNGYRIYQVDSVSNNGYTSSPTGEYFSDREEARRRVWQLNGWGTPKNRLN